MMEDCNHEYIHKAGIKCCKDAGHDGVHRAYEDGKTECEYTIYEWNDDGETCKYQEEYGRVFGVNYDEGREARQKTMNLAIHDAKDSLDEGVVFEIRAKVIPSDRVSEFSKKSFTRDDEAKKWGIAWYYIPKEVQPKGFEDEDRSTATEPLFERDVDHGEVEHYGGYILLARIKS